MRINTAGLNLLKSFEGWRGTAYRDPVGVWTIGYGHTSMAGHPEVYPGLKITRQQGEEILRRDLEKFAASIAPLLKVKLNENQYSALLSFAYNVGVGNFRKSSVLRYTNARRFSDVPARLMLWNKAGGRVLRGLTRRRQAEGALFVAAVNKDGLLKELSEVRRAAGKVTQRTGKSGLRSTTNRAGIALFLSALAGISSDIRATFSVVFGNDELVSSLGWKNSLSMILLMISLVAIWWIIKERRKKALDDGV